jgi:hypothetical protein
MGFSRHRQPSCSCTRKERRPPSAAAFSCWAHLSPELSGDCVPGLQPIAESLGGADDFPGEENSHPPACVTASGSLGAKIMPPEGP